LSAGIHTRQYSRAFIVDDGAKRVVFVSVDCALMDQVIKTEVRILILIVFKMNTV
jgi:neutral ceramidase